MNFKEYCRANWLIILFGCILYITSVVILFWNEGRALNVALSLDEASINAVTVNPNEPVINSHYENRLVHVTGSIICGEPLTEPDYGIEVLAVKLKRRVQMYQWIEEEVEYKFGESVATIQTEDRTYYYSADWRDNLVDSRNFYIRTGHHNPTKIPIESRLHIAEHVNIGYYELGDAAKLKISNFIQLTSDNRPEDPSVKMHQGFYFHCNDIWNPEIGDLRVIFSYAGLEGSVFTIVGKFHNGKIIPFETSLNINVLIVHTGQYTLEDAVKVSHQQHRRVTWGFRFIGWLLLFFSITCLSRLISFLLSENYILQRLAPLFNLLQPPSVCGNLILSFSICLIIASFSWTWHRPWIGIGMIFAALSPFLLFVRDFFPQYQRID